MRGTVLYQESSCAYNMSTVRKKPHLHLSKLYNLDEDFFRSAKQIQAHINIIRYMKHFMPIYPTGAEQVQPTLCFFKSKLLNFQGRYCQNLAAFLYILRYKYSYAPKHHNTSRIYKCKGVASTFEVVRSGSRSGLLWVCQDVGVLSFCCRLHVLFYF